MRAARGTKTKRGRDRWQLRVRVNGKRYTRTVHAESDEEAESALLDFRRELRDEGVPDRDPTVGELTNEWLAVMASRVRPRALVRYEQLLRIWAAPIWNVRVRKLRPGDVQRAVDGVLAQRAPRTALHFYRVLSQMLSEAERWGIAPNVARAVRPPRPSRPNTRTPTAEETRVILGAAAGSWIYGVVLLAVACGLRLGEALALRWRDVDLDGERLRVTGTLYRRGRTEPKSARSRRTVEIPAFAVRWLRAHRAEQTERRLASVAWRDTDLVFDRGGGEPMSGDSVTRRFAQLADQVGLGDVRYHDLRHAYATRLLERGVHPKIVSEALGHATIAITLDTYSHVMPSMSRVAAEAIEEVLGD